MGCPRLSAGASGKLETLPPGAADELHAHHFQLLSKGGVYTGKGEQIWRLAWPEEVLAGASLEAQGASLGAWIVETFELANAALSRP